MKEFSLEVEQQKRAGEIINVSGFPDDVIAKYPDLFTDCDFSKKGLAIFPNTESRVSWIKFCLRQFNEGQIEPGLCFRSINEALDDNNNSQQAHIKNNTLNPVLPEDINYRYGELSSFSSEIKKIVGEYISNLYREDKKSEMVTILKEIPLSLELFNELDESLFNNTKKEYLIFWLGYLKSPETSALLPKSISRAKEMLPSAIKNNLDIADYFIENLEDYYDQPWVGKCVINSMSHYSVANKFIAAIKEHDSIASDDQATYKSALVKWRDELWVKDALSIAQKNVKKHENQYREGLKEIDSYENGPWRFTTEQAKKAVVLAQIFEGTMDKAEAMKLGIDVDALIPIIKILDDVITGETLGKANMDGIKNNSKLSEEDKLVITESRCGSVEMRPLVSVMRSLLSRYLIQEVGDVNILGNKEQLKKFLRNKHYQSGIYRHNNPSGGYGYNDPVDHVDSLYNDVIPAYKSVLRDILSRGFVKFVEALEVDVPLYDKLYEEFDNLRETGRTPLEVYLGRDGIYAWIGRRAQDLARRRKLGLKGRIEQKEKGEIIEIHPQYTVYPRYFRDNINYETKRQFLEQEGICPDADPLFYDTGYTGTIPEQIMKVMDFDEDDIEKRIRLLSAPHPHRRVKGISENARSEIIEYIEHNSKTEESADGLILDERTGRIRHIAKPTSPEEQFYFNMVKQAIGRHYWLKEKLHHEPSGNINLDSEHYALRIREDYAKLLPPEFLHDPKTYLAEHGELLKSSKSEGKYPDEEIILFKLIGGIEIVAKKIELRKTKEARKEFSILISAKRAGLPTAEPIGFLSGKEETDGSYLLMKKIEGRPGRKFEKELRRSGKYTKERVDEIMEVVAEKNKEMVELFRTTLKIDKNWKIKDTIIEFDEETGEVGSIIPIDWERAKDYNPNSPQEIY